MTGTSPRISVLIAAFRSRPTIAATLDGLRAQRTPPHQILVVESSGDGAVELVRQRYPEVEVLAWPERLYPGAARNRALPRVEGEVAACLDADCVPDPDWTERIAQGLAEGHAALAGAVLNACDSSLVGWAYFLSEFVPWLPSPARPLSDAPTCNTAYRAELLRAAGGFTERPLLSADSLFHWGMRARFGTRLWFMPEMRVRHFFGGGMGELLRRRFEHGRSLSAARRVFRDPGSLRRLAEAVAAIFALPLFYVLRLVARAFGHPEVPRRPFLCALPLTALALQLWALGQAAGFLRRPPSAP
jgi:GT2 family glycosyltransferase